RRECRWAARLNGDGAGRAYVARYLVEMGVPRAAAAAPHVDVWVLSSQGAHEFTELCRVTGLEVPERAERDLVHQRGIGAQNAHPLEPAARLDRRHELQRVRAVDAVEGRPVITRLRVDGLDRGLQGWPRG